MIVDDGKHRCRFGIEGKFCYYCYVDDGEFICREKYSLMKRNGCRGEKAGIVRKIYKPI